MTRIALAAALLLTATPVLAQTSNDVTAAERTRAERAIRAAGYVPRTLATAQAGAMFFTATKGGTLHYLTVVNGQVMPGTTIPAAPAPAR